MSLYGNNAKEDMKKNEPNKLAAIINTVLSAIFLVGVIVLKVMSSEFSWILFSAFCVVLVMFPVASWYNFYYSKKQKQKMLKSFDKETNLVIEYMEHRKNFKVFDESPKIKVKATYEETTDELNKVNYNSEKSTLGFLDSNKAIISIGIGFAGIEVDPETLEVVDVKGMLPRSIWVPKHLKEPQNVITGKIKIETTGVDIRPKTYIQIEKQEDTYYNKKTGWLLIGEKKSYAINENIKFMDNAILVLQEGKIVGLWIKVSENLTNF